MARSSTKNTLTAGCAVTDITPPVGVELSGGPFGASKGVLHPLSAHALLLDDGSTKLMLISADLVGFDTSYADEIRAEIAAACGLDVDAVMLAGTHTHSGPATITYRNWGKPDAEYRSKLKGLLVALAQDAANSTFQAQLGFGVTHVPGIGANRSVPGGPTDPEVGLLRVDDTEGTTRVAVVTCGCHPGNLHNYKGLINPDFPWYARQRLNGEIGEQLTTLFFSSPFGDQNPANFRHGDPEAEAQETGEKFASGLLEAFKQVKTHRSASLHHATSKVSLPLAPLPDVQELEKERDTALYELKCLEAENAPQSHLAGPRTHAEWAEEALAV